MYCIVPIFVKEFVPVLVRRGRGLIVEYNEAIICFAAADIIEYHCFIESRWIQKDRSKKAARELQNDSCLVGKIRICGIQTQIETHDDLYKHK